MNAAVEFGEGAVEMRGLFAKERDKDGRVIVEGIRLHFIKRYPKVFVGP